MKFGRVQDINAVQFTLPDKLIVSDKLKQSNSKEPLSLHIGCTGWSMSEWKGEIYPSKSKASDFLKLYSQRFHTVELNSTFYTIPKVEQIKKWHDESADNFTFCPKVNRAISQSKDLGLSSSKLDDYLDSIVHFKDKLGPCFMQLPEYFDIKRWSLVKSFMDMWPSDMQLSIEFRHPSWFENDTVKGEVLQLFEEYNQSVLMTDVAGFRIGVHQIYSTNYAIIRWVGNDLHATDYQRIEEWTLLLQRLQSTGIKEVYFLIHEPNNVLAPKISMYLSDAVAEISSIEVKVRKPIEPDQLKLF